MGGQVLSTCLAGRGEPCLRRPFLEEKGGGELSAMEEKEGAPRPFPTFPKSCRIAQKEGKNSRSEGELSCLEHREKVLPQEEGEKNFFGKKKTAPSSQRKGKRPSAKKERGRGLFIFQGGKGGETCTNNSLKDLATSRRVPSPERKGQGSDLSLH